MLYVSVVTPLLICGALKRAVQILSGVEVDEADSGCGDRVSANVEAQ